VLLSSKQLIDRAGEDYLNALHQPGVYLAAKR